MHQFWPRRILILFGIFSLAACSDSPLEKAEKSLIEAHRELQSRISQRDSTEAGIRYSLSKMSDYSKESAIYQFHQVAKNGDAGTSEQLMVAKKILDDPLYERNLNSEYSKSKRDAMDALENIKNQEGYLSRDLERIREYLPEVKKALDEYEIAVADEIFHGRRPPVSPSIDAAIREIKKELALDVQRAYLEGPEAEGSLRK